MVNSCDYARVREVKKERGRRASERNILRDSKATEEIIVVMSDCRCFEGGLSAANFQGERGQTQVDKKRKYDTL